MENLRSDKRRIRRLISAWLAAALVVGFFVALSPSPAFACEDSGRGKVGCEGEDREEGDGNDGSDSDGNAPEPSEGDTWEEVRYVECVQWGEEQPEGYCAASNANECPEGTRFYMTYIRVWTYDGSQWTYDESLGGDDGWERDHSAEDCLDPEEVEGEEEEVTEDVVIRAFNSRPLPSGEVGANPPDGRTLVNLETIFYTDQGVEEFALPLREINRVVQISATPIRYDWDFGAGEKSFGSKGKAWEKGLPMSAYNTYTYTETGSFDVTLTIDYEVQFNDGAGWQTISEPITSQPSDPYEVQVLEQRNRIGNGN